MLPLPFGMGRTTPWNKGLWGGDQGLASRVATGALAAPLPGPISSRRSRPPTLCPGFSKLKKTWQLEINFPWRNEKIHTTVRFPLAAEPCTNMEHLF
jgi:hypothetical protein